jgi:hypothetical protein
MSIPHTWRASGQGSKSFIEAFEGISSRERAGSRSPSTGGVNSNQRGFSPLFTRAKGSIHAVGALTTSGTGFTAGGSTGTGSSGGASLFEQEKTASAAATNKTQTAPEHLLKGKGKKNDTIMPPLKGLKPNKFLRIFRNDALKLLLIQSFLF